jgi:hypothetical protein
MPPAVESFVAAALNAAIGIANAAGKIQATVHLSDCLCLADDTRGTVSHPMVIP